MQCNAIIIAPYTLNTKCMNRINEPLICSSIEHFGVWQSTVLYGIGGTLLPIALHAHRFHQTDNEREGKKDTGLWRFLHWIYRAPSWGFAHTHILFAGIIAHRWSLAFNFTSPKLLFFYCSCFSCIREKFVVKVNSDAIHIWAIVDGTKELFYSLTIHWYRFCCGRWCYVVSFWVCLYATWHKYNPWAVGCVCVT